MATKLHRCCRTLLTKLVVPGALPPILQDVAGVVCNVPQWTTEVPYCLDYNCKEWIRCGCTEPQKSIRWHIVLSYYANYIVFVVVAYLKEDESPNMWRRHCHQGLFHVGIIAMTRIVFCEKIRGRCYLVDIIFAFFGHLLIGRLLDDGSSSSTS